MKVQEYSLTGNEKFSVWHTAMLMMTDAQLDHDSKERIMNSLHLMKKNGIGQSLKTVSVILLWKVFRIRSWK